MELEHYWLIKINKVYKFGFIQYILLSLKLLLGKALITCYYPLMLAVINLSL